MNELSQKCNSTGSVCPTLNKHSQFVSKRPFDPHSHIRVPDLPSVGSIKPELLGPNPTEKIIKVDAVAPRGTYANPDHLR